MGNTTQMWVDNAKESGDTMLSKDFIKSENPLILVTGAAGFIGAALVKKLLSLLTKGTIIGIDSMNDYYDVKLKEWRLNDIRKALECTNDVGCHFVFNRCDISDKEKLARLFGDYSPDYVIHLAAQAGVRYSIDHPDDYIKSNIIGTYNILEMCRWEMLNGFSKQRRLKHLIFASSSSVYGDALHQPVTEHDDTDHPVSLYAATKKSTELLAYSYAKLYRIPITGLRFFTVYGPAGRPDMAYYAFAEKMRKGEKIHLFNNGDSRRDFTYIDDIIEGILRIIDLPSHEEVPYSVFNIGGQNPILLRDFVSILSEELIHAGVLPDNFELAPLIEYLPMQPGDVKDTYSDCSMLRDITGYAPDTDFRTGIRQFVEWYAEYIRT